MHYVHTIEDMQISKKLLERLILIFHILQFDVWDHSAVLNFSTLTKIIKVFVLLKWLVNSLTTRKEALWLNLVLDKSS